MHLHNTTNQKCWWLWIRNSLLEQTTSNSCMHYEQLCSIVRLSCCLVVSSFPSSVFSLPSNYRKKLWINHGFFLCTVVKEYIGEVKLLLRLKKNRAKQRPLYFSVATGTSTETRNNWAMHVSTALLHVMWMHPACSALCIYLLEIYYMKNKRYISSKLVYNKWNIWNLWIII